MTVARIQTVYAGYRFRSRTEARWAVFFDSLGVSWEYEKEGYELPCGWYLPDFWLPNSECFVEVKGAPLVYPPEDGDPEPIVVRQICDLAKSTGHDVALVCGTPGPWGNGDDGAYFAVPFPRQISGGFNAGVWRLCERGHSPALAPWFSSCNELSLCPVCGIDHPSDEDPRIEAAYIAARSERFEHGEGWRP